MTSRNERHRLALAGLTLGAILLGVLLTWWAWLYVLPGEPQVARREPAKPLEAGYQPGGAACDPKRLNALSAKEAPGERERCTQAREDHRVQQAELYEAARANDLAEENLRLVAHQNRTALAQTLATIWAFIAAGVAAVFAGMAAIHAKRSADADNLALRATRRANREARKDAAEQGARFSEQMAKQQELVEYTAKTAYAMDHAATAQRGAASAMRASAEAAQETLAHTRDEAKSNAKRAKEQLLLQDQTMQYTAETAHAMRDSARAALRSAYTIPILERAYVSSEVTAEYVRSALEGAMHPNGGHSPEPSVSLRFKNFGKTPATLVHGEVFFSLADGKPRPSSARQWPIEYQQMLGAAEATVAFTWDLGSDLATHEAQAIKSGEVKLRLWGWMTYLDVFEEEHRCDIGWTYNNVLGRMVPDDPRKSDSRKGRGRSLAV